jgi:hypothetical protein
MWRNAVSRGDTGVGEVQHACVLTTPQALPWLNMSLVVKTELILKIYHITSRCFRQVIPAVRRIPLKCRNLSDPTWQQVYCLCPLLWVPYRPSVIERAFRRIIYCLQFNCTKHFIHHTRKGTPSYTNTVPYRSYMFRHHLCHPQGISHQYLKLTKI